MLDVGPEFFLLEATQRLYQGKPSTLKTCEIPWLILILDACLKRQRKVQAGTDKCDWNVQVATDTRLWLYNNLKVTRGYLADLIKAAVARAEAEVDVLMPGFTHLQPAQTVRGSNPCARFPTFVFCELLSHMASRNDAQPHTHTPPHIHTPTHPHAHTHTLAHTHIRT